LARLAVIVTVSSATICVGAWAWACMPPTTAPRTVALVNTARAKALILALNWFWAVMVCSFQVGCAGGALHV